MRLLRSLNSTISANVTPLTSVDVPLTCNPSSKPRSDPRFSQHWPALPCGVRPWDHILLSTDKIFLCQLKCTVLIKWTYPATSYISWIPARITALGGGLQKCHSMKTTFPAKNRVPVYQNVWSFIFWQHQVVLAGLMLPCGALQK